MTGEETQVIAIRQRLKRAWIPFFGRFGRLTPIQIKAIPKVLDGANVVVASPTASGKTEAVFAPVAERLKTEGCSGLAVLYVVPTRALANDALARIQGPLEEMGLSTELKHGDRPYLLAKRLPNCLVTTPESLDSLICRRPVAFEDLRTVILDEIHLLDNTYRGDQLRILLARLRKLACFSSFSTHLLSATLADPEGVGQRYASEFTVVSVPSQREAAASVLDTIGQACDLARARQWWKMLVFCNRRQMVESVATNLAPLWHPYPVVVHHGSLARHLREEAEAVMRESQAAICVATSTLEIGIDIGDIDLVILAELPWSLSSFLQRVGRGNRRENVVRVAAVAPSNQEKALFEAMCVAASSGALTAKPYNPDLSVVVQQVFSCLYQHPYGVAEESLMRVLTVLCSRQQALLILSHLRETGWVESRRGYWYASTKLMDLGERGTIHSNIPDDRTFRVVDVASGRRIGMIAGVFDSVFVLGQRLWRVVAVKDDVIQVRSWTGKALAPWFVPHGHYGAFYPLLPPELRMP